ncbi:MAG: hypothetical protein U9P11_02695, partial [Pseudomonadota bacterium]|nr:hypothetical protein [Pseudomonadota bacterium]
MKFRKSKYLAIALVLPFISGGAIAFDNGGSILLNSHSFHWTDPESEGEVWMTENVYEGCTDEAGLFIPHDMTFEYVVENHSYDPIPGTTNGYSGFQILFPSAVPELHSQRSPTVGGPWQQNAFSGQFPPFGVEWDAALPGVGIMPGETGTFSFCTAERVDVVVEAEGQGQGPAGWAHTWGLEVPEEIIDADGIATAGVGGPGDINVAIGDPLTSWVIPTGGVEGIDWFDNDASCTWTAGDDIHLEGSLGTCTTGVRNAIHDLGRDCKVLDLDGSFFTGQPVSVDLEGNLDFNPSGLCGTGVDPRMTFFDANNSGRYENGEDIVLDSNGDGIFGTVANVQTFIFHGDQSVPGEEMGVVGITCSDGQEVCKKAKYVDNDGDRIIEVGEPIDFLEVIQVHNDTGENWGNVVVTDRWGAEIGVTSANPTKGTVTLTTKGKSEKVFLEWDIGMLLAGETANLVLRTATDLNPAGKQEYSECSYHEYNSGAVLKYRNEFNKQRSFGSGELVVSVLTEDALGDCDGDGFIDADDPNPHDPLDPRCGGGVDLCIDADGIASPLSGLPGNTEVVEGASLTNWPTGFDPDDHGIDSFDNDGNELWTFGPNGDDIHIEGASAACPTGLRNAAHVVGS